MIPFNEQLTTGSLRADAIRPLYGCAGDVSLKYRQLSANKIYVLYENGGKTL